jgi:hypothetical protein
MTSRLGAGKGTGIFFMVCGCGAHFVAHQKETMVHSVIVVVNYRGIITDAAAVLAEKREKVAHQRKRDDGPLHMRSYVLSCDCCSSHDI